MKSNIWQVFQFLSKWFSALILSCSDKSQGQNSRNICWGCKTQIALEGFKANKCYRLGLEGPAKTVVEGSQQGVFWELVDTLFLLRFILFLNSLGMRRRRKGKRGDRQTDRDKETETPLSQTYTLSSLLPEVPLKSHPPVLERWLSGSEHILLS